MLKFTDVDVEFYKAALARYVAKEKCLIDKWSNRLEFIQKAIDDMDAVSYLSAKDREFLAALHQKFDMCNDVLMDIRTPCDSFITDYEWSKVK